MTRDAATGDLVKIVLARSQKRRDKPERLRGKIIHVIERRTRQFVGSCRQLKNEWVVQVDGTVFPNPIPVGDPSAHNIQPSDKVVVEMVRFPSASTPGEAVLLEVLGKKGDPGVDTQLVIREFQLPGDFPDEVLANARQQADNFDPEQINGRADLTRSTIITIDPADARDFDDAISLRRLENGHWRLGVHIADVSHFVPAGSKLDREAYQRATSVYLPDQVIPMLPEIISNNLASLQPDRRRYAKSVFIEMTDGGAVVDIEVTNSVIQSARRFSYEEVDQFLADPESWRDKLSETVWDLLDQMHQLAMILRQRRLDRGALELSVPEVKIKLNELGQVNGAELVVNTVSHQMIEEFMLAANQAVAQYIMDQGLLFIRRQHGDPAERRLADLTRFAQDVGFQCDKVKGREDIVQLVEAARGSPQEPAMMLAILRSMQKAVYGPQPERHFALNMENYCHFTSPIRRYPDLTVHRLLDQMAAGRKPRQDMPELESVSQHCSEMEQRAAVAERTLTKLKLLNYLANRIGEELPAVVTGVEEYGLFVQGTEIPADGLLRVDSLPKDSYRFAAETYSLTGFRKGNQFRLGDRLQVKVMRVDVDRRELDFRLVKVLEQPGGPRTARTQEDSPGRRRTANKSNKSAKSSKSSKSGKRGAGRRKRRG